MQNWNDLMAGPHAELLTETSWCEIYRLRYPLGDLIATAAVKKSKKPAFNESAGLSREAANLKALNAQTTTEVGVPGSITPVPLALFEYLGCQCLAMEWVYGKPLRDIVTEHRPMRLDDPVRPPIFALRAFEDFLRVLRVLHGTLRWCASDLKRDSVLVGLTGIRILDWNVVAPLTSEEQARRDLSLVVQWSIELLTNRMYRDLEACYESLTALRGSLKDLAEDPVATGVFDVLLGAVNRVGRASETSAAIESMLLDARAVQRIWMLQTAESLPTMAAMAGKTPSIVTATADQAFERVADAYDRLIAQLQWA